MIDLLIVALIFGYCTYVVGKETSAEEKWWFRLRMFRRLRRMQWKLRTYAGNKNKRVRKMAG